MAKALICLCLFLLTQHLYLLSVASVLRSMKAHVSTYWKKIFTYNNTYSYPITQSIQWTNGLKTRTNGKLLVATQTLGPDIDVGQQFEITRLEFIYMDDSDSEYSDYYHPKNSRDIMEADEIYQQRPRQSNVVIPARTRLTKWQLVANVAGHEVGYDHTVETCGNTMPHIHTSHKAIGHKHNLGYDHDDDDDDDANDYHNLHNHTDHQSQQQQHYYGHHHNDFSHAELALIWEFPIHYGTTRILIRHKATNQYLTVARYQSKMSPATVSSFLGSQFILYNSSSGIKVRTLNPVNLEYEYLTSDANGQLYFTRNNRGSKQHWVVNKTTHHSVVNKTTRLFDQDVVTFRNNGNGKGFLRYYIGRLMTQVYRANGNDEWMLHRIDEGD